MVSVGGLASGLDTQGIITQLLELERRPINSLQQDIAELQQVQATFTGLSTRFAELNAASALLSTDNLDQPTASVLGGASGISVSATSAANAGRHDITVSQLATVDRLGSQGFVDADTTPISGGTGNFVVQLGASGAQISVAVTTATTMNDLANAINAAAGDISASVVDDGTNAASSRLVLTGGTTGRLNDIRIISNPTNLDFTNNTIEATSADANNAGTYTGTVTSSGTYTGTTNKTFIMEIVTAGAAGSAPGSATYRFSTDGGLTFDDNGGAGYFADTAATAIGGNTEGVNVAFSNSGTLATGDRFYVDVSTPALTEATDAVFTLDGITQSRSSNTVSDALAGITIELETTTTGAVSFAVNEDDARIVEAVQNFVDGYNGLFNAIRSEQTFDADTLEAGLLLGDRTANTILSQLRSTLTRTVTGTGSTFDTLASLGITSSQTGGLTFDSTEFSEALSSDREGVLAVLASTESTSSSQISVVSRPTETDDGTYAVNVSTAPEKAMVVAGGAMTDTLGGNEVLNFTYSSNNTEASPTLSAFSVTLASGDSLSNVIDKINSAFATQGARLRAFASSNVINIESTEYGADMFFSVVSDTASGANTTRIGTTNLNDDGVTIAGTINGESATGTANVLAVSDASSLDGLRIAYTGASTGLVGTATISTGVGGGFQDAVDSLSAGTDSVLGIRNASLQDQIEQIQDRIADREEIVARTQARLEEEFASLEVELAGLQSQADFLTNQLTQLSNSGQGSGSGNG